MHTHTVPLPRPAGRTAVLLGVDGGGTRTRAVVADATGRVLGHAVAEGSNQATAGSAAAARAVRRAVTAALAQAGADPADVVGACLGLAGLDRPVDEAAFRPAVEDLGLAGVCLLVNDSVIAWAGATGGAPGIAVIAGTGSVAYGRNAAGTGRRAGGWGGVLGDEGSAFRIAAAAVNRVLRAIDGRDPPTSLAEELARAAGVEDPADLCLLARADRAASGVPPETAVAALAPVVVRAAAAGQPEAAAIVEEAGRELAALAAAIAEGLEMRHPDVHGLGSVLLAADSPVAEAMERHLRARLGVGLRRPRHPALVGALVLAFERAYGRLPPPGVAESWTAGCGG